MRAFAVLLHLLDFVAPALWMALCLPALSRLLWRGMGTRMPWALQSLIHAGVGGLILLAGLVLFDRDGAMLTYVALVVVAAALQWHIMRGA